VQEKGVRQPCQPLPRLGVAGGDGLLGDVARGHHQRQRERRAGAGRLQKQIVQRRVRQHHAERVVARSDEGRDRAARPLVQQDDGPLPRGEQRPLLVAHLTVAPHGLQVERHNGEGLIDPPFPPTEPAHRLVVRRIAGQVEAAETLHSHNVPGPQELPRRPDGRVSVRLRPHPQTLRGEFQPDAGAADGAGVGLGVEAAIRRIIVLRLASGAHAEGGHRRLGPIVGDIADDGEARAAVRAVDEGIAVASVARVKKLSQAIVADGDVGRDGLELAGPGLGVADDEGIGRQALDAVGSKVLDRDVLDAGHGRRLRAQALDKLVQRRARPHCLDLDARGTVQHPAGKPQAGSEVVDEGAESHSLDDARDTNAAADEGLHLLCVHKTTILPPLPGAVQAVRGLCLRLGHDRLPFLGRVDVVEGTQIGVEWPHLVRGDVAHPHVRKEGDDAPPA